MNQIGNGLCTEVIILAFALSKPSMTQMSSFGVESVLEVTNGDINRRMPVYVVKVSLKVGQAIVCPTICKMGPRKLTGFTIYMHL